MLSKSTTITLAFASLALLLGACAVTCQNSGKAVDVEQRKQIAGDLRDNKLYTAAIEEYQKILDSDALDNTQRGNINYLIARICFDDLKDYEAAAAYYVRARSYNADASYSSDLARNLVASLEKLGRVVDARRELSAVTDINAGPHQTGDIPVALIGPDTVWQSEVEARIQSMPTDMQKQFVSRQARSDFARQYVGMELMYRAAVREGYDRDPEIMRSKEILYKNLLVEKFVRDRVMPEVKIDTADIRNFYLAHKAGTYKSAPFDSVKAQVLMDYQSQKAQSAYLDYLSKLIKSENVTFLDHNIK
jgi:tetratricopeptide (TPR) repeat protein